MCVGAVVLIANIAGESDLGGTTFRLIYIALALALLSTSAAAGVLLAARWPRRAGLGYLTVPLRCSPSSWL